MIELEINNEHKIIKFCNEIKDLIPNLDKYGWNKKFICEPNNIHYQNTDSPNDFIVYNKFYELIENIVYIMNNNNFSTILDLDYTKINTEFHYANTDDTICYPHTAIHDDEGNGFLLNVVLVNVCICYFDIKCEDGELIFYDKDEKIIESISTKSQQLNHTKVIIFPGNLLHNPAPIINGYRYAISFQIPRFT